MERDRSHHDPAGPEPAGPHPEREPSPYSLAALFRTERPAARAYQQAQDLIYHADTELSAYRFQFQRRWHVAVVGEEPATTIHQQIEQILSTGEPVTLPAEVLSFLVERRRRAAQLGPWVEGHYRDRQGGDAP